MNKDILIRTSRHSIKFTNTGKREVLCRILTEYRDAVNFYIKHYWNTKTTWEDKKGNVLTLDVKHENFDIPCFTYTKDLYPETSNLSAKLFRSASTQAIGLIASVINKHKKLLFKLNVAIASGNLQKAEKLQKQVDETFLTCPEYKSLSANLDSNTLKFLVSNEDGVIFEEFDGFLYLNSLSRTEYGKNFAFPIKFTRHTRNLIKSGYSQMTSWILEVDSFNSLWSKPKPKKKESGKKVGADQGIKTCLTLSDGQITKECPHGHSIESIMKTLSRCKKGSKGFKKAQEHRKNYINWSIKQLNLVSINEIGYENVKNVRKGKNTSNFMKGWTYTEIRTAVERICEETGVQLTSQGSIYRSQRCSNCGYVHKKNRKAKAFECLDCGHELDSDLNAALNHEADLDSIPYSILGLKLNMKGFFWKESGLFDIQGREIAVPGAQEIKP